MVSWKCNHKKKKNKQICSCERLVTRDFVYIIIISILIIIFILTMTLGNTAEANNRFSFASTITSIVLSVVAIIMSLFAEYKNDRAFLAVDEARKNLEHEGKKLEDATLRLITRIGLIEARLSRMLKDIGAKLDDIKDNKKVIIKADQDDKWNSFNGDCNGK